MQRCMSDGVHDPENDDDTAPEQTDAERCPECGGTGRRDGRECPACEGTGNRMRGLGGG
jgi:DnaJ-class molecular chaperone